MGAFYQYRGITHFLLKSHLNGFIHNECIGFMIPRFNSLLFCLFICIDQLLQHEPIHSWHHTHWYMCTWMRQPLTTTRPGKPGEVNSAWSRRVLNRGLMASHISNSIFSHQGSVLLVFKISPRPEACLNTNNLFCDLFWKFPVLASTTIGKSHVKMQN